MFNEGCVAVVASAGEEPRRDADLIALFRRHCTVAPERHEGTPGSMMGHCSRMLPKGGLRPFLQRHPEAFEIHNLRPLQYSLLPFPTRLGGDLGQPPVPPPGDPPQDQQQAPPPPPLQEGPPQPQQQAPQQQAPQPQAPQQQAPQQQAPQQQAPQPQAPQLQTPQPQTPQPKAPPPGLGPRALPPGLMGAQTQPAWINCMDDRNLGCMRATGGPVPQAWQANQAQQWHGSSAWLSWWGSQEWQLAGDR